MSEVAEKTAEVVEEVLDDVEDTITFVRYNPRLLVFTGALGFAAGAVGGYFYAKKKLKAVYEDLATEEIAEAKRFYSNLNKVDEDGVILSPMDVLVERHGMEEAVAALRTYQGEETEEDRIAAAKAEHGEPHDDVRDEEHIRKLEASLKVKKADKEVEVTEEVSLNIFEDPTFDLVEEKKYRTPDKPYVINHDEYYAAERDFEQSRLTYYEVDDTLTDEQDTPIENVDDMVGNENLARFGHGSKDKNVVYVRNERLGLDFEIVRSKGSYLEEVLGMMPEEPNSLKHSDQRDARRAFRHGDG